MSFLAGFLLGAVVCYLVVMAIGESLLNKRGQSIVPDEDDIEEAKD